MKHSSWCVVAICIVLTILCLRCGYDQERVRDVHTLTQATPDTQKPKPAVCARDLAIPLVQSDGFNVQGANKQYFTISYAGIEFVTGGCLTFFPGGEKWRPVFELDPMKMQIKHGVDSGMATAHAQDKECGAYTVTMQWKGNRFEADVEYETVAGGKVGKVGLDFFLNKALFAAANWSMKGKKTAGEFGALGTVESVTFDIWMGKVVWTVSEECLDTSSAVQWVLRDTTVQKWRQKRLQTLSVLHLARFPMGKAQKRKLRIMVEVIPRPDLGQVLAAYYLRRLIERLTFGQINDKRAESTHAEATQIKRRLSAIIDTVNYDKVAAAAIVKQAGKIAAALVALGQPAQPERPAIIPEPQKMTACDGFFTIDKQVVILLKAQARGQDRRGAVVLHEELRDYFGVNVPIVCADAVPQGKRAIVIGVAGHGGAADRINQRDGLDVSGAKPGPEGYAMVVSPDQVVVVGSDAAGAFYGVQSLLQLLTRTEAGLVHIPCVRIRDWPAMKIRGMYIPLSCRSPLAYYRRVIRRVIARTKCNWLLIGPDGELGSIRWPSHPEIAKKNAFTADEVRGLMSFAREHFLEIVPLVRCLGKVKGTLAAHPELAEVKGKRAFCLSNPKVREFLADIYTDALDIFKPKVFNIPCDEVKPIGVCPRCRKTPAYKLVADQIIWAHDWLKARGVRTMMVQDMLLDNKV